MINPARAIAAFCPLPVEMIGDRPLESLADSERSALADEQRLHFDGPSRPVPFPKVTLNTLRDLLEALDTEMIIACWDNMMPKDIQHRWVFGVAMCMIITKQCDEVANRLRDFHDVELQRNLLSIMAGLKNIFRRFSSRETLFNLMPLSDTWHVVLFRSTYEKWAPAITAAYDRVVASEEYGHLDPNQENTSRPAGDLSKDPPNNVSTLPPSSLAEFQAWLKGMVGISSTQAAELLAHVGMTDGPLQEWADRAVQIIDTGNALGLIGIVGRPTGPITRVEFHNIIDKLRVAAREVTSHTENTVVQAVETPTSSTHNSDRSKSAWFHSGHDECDGDWSAPLELAVIARAIKETAESAKQRLKATGLIQKSRQGWIVKLDELRSDWADAIQSVKKKKHRNDRG